MITARLHTAGAAAPALCLYCDRRPADPALAAERRPDVPLGLCRDCQALPCVRLLYARRHPWTPAREARLLHLTRRATLRLPLFEDEA